MCCQPAASNHNTTRYAAEHLREKPSDFSSVLDLTGKKASVVSTVGSSSCVAASQMDCTDTIKYIVFKELFNPSPSRL